MKKIKILTTVFILISMFISNNIQIYAASFNVAASTSAVSPGGNFTVTISVNGAGQFAISGNNASVSTSSIWCENSCSVSATAGSSGNASVSVSASDVTGFDETPVTGTKNVSINIRSNTNGNETYQPNTPDNENENTPANKNEENKKEEAKTISLLLNSLSIDNLELLTTFEPNTTSYEVNVPYGMNKLKINAEPADNKTTVQGIGEVDIKEVDSSNIIVSNPITGEKKEYILNFIKEKTPSLKVMGLNNKEVGVIENYDNAPEIKNFEDIKMEINSKEIMIKKHKEKNIVLLFILDDNNKEQYYIYNQKENKLISIYIPININEKYYAIITSNDSVKNLKGLKYSNFKLNEIDIEGLMFDEEKLSDYFILNLMNEVGNENLYLYDTKESTLQRYSNQASVLQEDYENLIKQLEQKDKMLVYYLIGFGLLAVILLIVVVVLFIKVNKKPKKIVNNDILGNSAIIPLNNDIENTICMPSLKELEQEQEQEQEQEEQEEQEEEFPSFASNNETISNIDNMDDDKN